MGVSVSEAQRSLLAHLRKWLRADRLYDASKCLGEVAEGSLGLYWDKSKFC